MNPRRETVAGLPCFPKPADHPGPADLAIIAIGAERIVDMVRECAAAGIDSGIVWAGGFAETGGEGMPAASRRSSRRAAKPGSSSAARTASASSTPGSDDRQLRLVPARDGRRAAAGQHLDDQPERRDGHRQPGSRPAGRLRLPVRRQHRQRGRADRRRLHPRASPQDPETRVIAVYLEGVADGDKLLRAPRRGARRATSPSSS